MMMMMKFKICSKFRKKKNSSIQAAAPSSKFAIFKFLYSMSRCLDELSPIESKLIYYYLFPFLIIIDNI